MIIRDLLGQEIHIGDYIIYRTSSRSGDLHVGKVTKINPKKVNSFGRLLATVHVRGVHEDYTATGPTPFFNRVAEGDSYLSKLNAMIVYHNVPQEIKDLYDKAGL